MELRKLAFWTPFYLSIFAVIFWSSFSLSSLSFFDEKKVIQSIVLLFSSCIFVLLILKYKIQAISQSKKQIFIFWLALLYISSIFAPLSEWAFLQVGWYVLLIQLFLISVLLYSKDKKRFLHTLLIGLLLLCTIYICRVYADYIIGTVHDYWTIWPEQRNIKIIYQGINLYPSGFLNFGHVRFFNHLQTWSLPLLVFAYLYYKEKIISGLRYLLIFAIASWWMLVFAADARGTMLASIISLILIVLLFRYKTISFLKIYGSTALLGLVFYLVLFLFPRESSREILTRFGDSGRWEVWLFSFEQIAQNPWLGLGPMHFSYLGINPPWSTPHNFLLQSATEWGIPAILIFTGFCLYAYYHFINQSLKIFRQAKSEIDLNWRIALIASVSAALVHSMFSGIFNSQLSQLLGVLILGASVGDYFITSNQDFFQKRQKRSWPVYVLILIVFVNTTFVCIKVVSDIPHLNDRQREYMEEYRSLTLYPRFWNQGMIYERNNIEQDSGEIENRE